MNKIYQKAFPRSKTAGFTLIELLVVVLIIGILAAVALPQYDAAVRKAQYVKLMTNAKTLWQAEQRYRLANGNYTVNLADLDVQLPGEDKGSYIVPQKGYMCALQENNFGDFSFVYCAARGAGTVNLAHYIGLAGNEACMAYDGDVRAEKTCLALGGKLETSTEGYKSYALN